MQLDALNTVGLLVLRRSSVPETNSVTLCKESIIARLEHSHKPSKPCSLTSAMRLDCCYKSSLLVTANSYMQATRSPVCFPITVVFFNVQCFLPFTLLIFSQNHWLSFLNTQMTSPWASHRGAKNVGWELSWCRPYPEFHQPCSPFLMPSK